MHATTGDFVAADDWMDVQCLNPECRRTVWLKGQLITKSFPVSTPIAEAEKRMRCKCGHRGARIQVKLPFPHELPYDPKAPGSRTAS